MNIPLNKAVLINTFDDNIFKSEFKRLFEKLQEHFVFFREVDYNYSGEVYEIYFCQKKVWSFLELLKGIFAIDYNFGNLQVSSYRNNKPQVFMIKYNNIKDNLALHPIPLSINIDGHIISLTGKYNAIFFLENNGDIKKYSIQRNFCYEITSFKSLFHEHVDIVNFFIFAIKTLNCKANLWLMWHEFDFTQIRMAFCSFSELFTLHTKQQIIEYLFAKKIKYNLNKVRLDWGISLVYWFDYLYEKDFQKLIESLPILEKLSLDSRYSMENVTYKQNGKIKRIKVYNIPVLFLMHKTSLYGDESSWVFDYVRMTLELKEKINLNINSFSSLHKKHDLVSYASLKHKHKRKKMVVHPIYKTLKFSKDFKLIKTYAKLVEESLSQSHCVHSYHSSINKGNCAIFSTSFEGYRYTVEIGVTRAKKFTFRQAKGFKNSAAPSALVEKIKGELKNQNLVPTGK